MVKAEFRSNPPAPFSTGVPMQKYVRPCSPQFAIVVFMLIVGCTQLTHCSEKNSGPPPNSFTTAASRGVYGKVDDYVRVDLKNREEPAMPSVWKAGTIFKVKEVHENGDVDLSPAPPNDKNVVTLTTASQQTEGRNNLAFYIVQKDMPDFHWIENQYYGRPADAMPLDDKP